MIEFANKETTPLVRRMWKICFDDTEEYIDLYFSKKYSEENTLIYFENGEAVASLQMLPYTITFNGQTIPFAYLAGLCTLPQHRQKGYMAQLIYKAHSIIKERNISLAILIPAEDWLYGFYEKYGYAQVFDQDDVPIPLGDIINKYSDPQEAYTRFDKLFRNKDFCVQKSFKDFEAIREDYILDGCPIKTNLSAMARVIQPDVLLNLYAKENPTSDLKIKLRDQDTVYHICKGRVVSVNRSSYDIEVDVPRLTRLLFGYKIKGLGELYTRYFEECSPIINLMLE